MFPTILATLLLAPAPSPALTPPTPLVFQDSADEKEAKRAIEQAGEDVGALLALADQWTQADQKDLARLAYERVLQLDDGNEVAHKALRHHLYDGQWFTSYASLSKYKREETKRMEAKGLARFGDEWVPKADLPFLRMGWVKEGDRFVDPARAKREKEAAELSAKGYQQRAEDSEWIAPADFDHWKEGQYLVEGKWVSGEEADAYHSQIPTAWRYQGQHYVAYTTCDHVPAASVVWWADKTYDSLKRLFGVEPDEKPMFACLRSLDQYNAFAAGDQNAGIPPAELGGFSSFHFAFRGDAWALPPSDGGTAPTYIGGGVAFYDVATPNLAPWGQYAARYAAGLSYAEYIDRPWETISSVISGGGGGGQVPDLWKEKRIPRWLAYGGASYVERFYRDVDAEANGGDPWGVRTWAIGQLAAGGAMTPLEELFAFKLDLSDPDGSSRRMQEVGLVTAFVLDGGCKPVEAAHAKFVAAMKSGADTADAVTALQQAILDNQKALEKFTGIEVAEPAPEEPATEGAAQ